MPETLYAARRNPSLCMLGGMRHGARRNLSSLRGSPKNPEITTDIQSPVTQDDVGGKRAQNTDPCKTL